MTNRDHFLKMIHDLVEIPGPPGQEQEVIRYLSDYAKPFADSIRIDRYGNLITSVGTNRPYKVAIVAHMDEVALIVKNIEANGAIRFEKAGIIDDRVLPGREVDIMVPDGLQRGAIGTKSRHLLAAEEMNRIPGYKEMWIDVGTSSKEQTEQLGITVGCGICFATTFSSLADGTMLAKALDDRIGCAVMIETLKRLASEPALSKVQVYGIGTAQEEIGARGAAVAAYGLDLDLAIVLDTVPVENPVVSLEKQTVRLNGGPVIRIFDIHMETLRGAISKPEIVDRLVSTAKSNTIPHQIDVLSGTFLDSTNLHLTGPGIPSGSVCFPRKYSHSPVEMASVNDALSAVELLVGFVKSLEDSPLYFEKIIK